MAGICDRCQRPGACCSGFMLISGGVPAVSGDTNAAEVLTALRKLLIPTVNDDVISPPFEPFYKDLNGRWHWWCRYWKAGRCSIYENRPWLCKDMEPQSDPLCYHYDHATAHLFVKKPQKGEIINLLEKSNG